MANGLGRPWMCPKTAPKGPPRPRLAPPRWLGATRTPRLSPSQGLGSAGLVSPMACPGAARHPPNAKSRSRRDLNREDPYMPEGRPLLACAVVAGACGCGWPSESESPANVQGPMARLSLGCFNPETWWQANAELHGKRMWITAAAHVLCTNARAWRGTHKRSTAYKCSANKVLTCL